MSKLMNGINHILNAIFHVISKFSAYLVELEARPEVPVVLPERPEVAAQDVVADYCYCLGW